MFIPESFKNADVYILRGLPGSGKTTFVRELEKYTPVLHCSADNYFINIRGEYVFDVRKLNAAHDKCYSDFYKCLNSGLDWPIIVDNTNTKLSEYKRYYELAEEYVNNIIIVRFNCNKELSMSRGLHSVPEETIDKMIARFEDDAREYIIY